MRERERPSTSAAERVARNLRELREREGLTLAQLSARLEANGYPLSINTLSKIERAKRVVDVDDLEALAEALQTTVPRVLGKADPEDVLRAEDMASEIASLDRRMIEAERRVNDAQARLRDEEVKLQALRGRRALVMEDLFALSQESEPVARFFDKTFNQVTVRPGAKFVVEDGVVMQVVYEPPTPEELEAAWERMNESEADDGVS